MNTTAITQQQLNYIHNNPVKAGFVENPSDWVCSSARDYEDKQGLVEISFLYYYYYVGLSETLRPDESTLTL